MIVAYWKTGHRLSPTQERLPNYCPSEEELAKLLAASSVPEVDALSFRQPTERRSVPCHVCRYIAMHLQDYVCRNMQKRVGICKCLRTCTAHVCVYLHIHMHRIAHTHIHACTHTHTRTRASTDTDALFYRYRCM